MGAPLKTEAVVLRSIRYGEADRVLHLYTADRGRVGAIAKGVRRSRSRFGGRLEPFFRVALLLHEGRGDLHTVTGAETVVAHPRLREHGGALDGAARACDAVARLFATDEAHPAVYALLCNELALLDARPEQAGRAQSARLPDEAPARRRAEPAALALRRMRGARAPQRLLGRGGRRRVRRPARHRPSPLDEAAHGFLVEALGRPLADAPAGTERTLGQAERAIGETLEHHAHVRLRPAAS